MNNKLLVSGGGIAGLAAALACSRAGWQIDVLEQAAQFGELGAGVQLGPNVVKVLHGWGLEQALQKVASYPAQLEVRNALTTQRLGVLPLGQPFEARYGAPYITIARVDLHRLLLAAVQAAPGTVLHLDARVCGIAQDPQRVRLQTEQNQVFEAPLLVAADGVWSQARKQVVNDGAARLTGHLAFRAMLPQSDLPALLRSRHITAWLGPEFHAVCYPVAGGQWLNVVCVVQGKGKGKGKGKVLGNPESWDHSANAHELRSRMALASGGLRELIHAIDQWRVWPLCDRAPMASAAEHAKGRIALIGDAAHPMRPYLAQGAGMAIEDAAVLAECLGTGNPDIPLALAQFAKRRWQRNARVQARAIRNGQIYHFKGLAQVGRDMALKLLGGRLMDLPWLYKGP